MEKNKLKQLAGRTETAKRIIEFVADRQRNTVYTAFSGLRADIKAKDKKPVNKKEFNQAFDELEKMGAGKVNKSQRGTYKGFTWSAPIRNIGQILKGSDSQPDTKEEEKVTVIVMKKNAPAQTYLVDASKVLGLDL